MAYLKFIVSLVTAVIFVLAFRALAFTIYTIPCTERECGLLSGDRVVVNRWSYGLRSGDDRLFAYTRLIHSSIERGDVVAFNPPTDTLRRGFLRSVLIGRIRAVPGDTVGIGRNLYSLPKTLCPSPCLGPEYYLVTTENGVGKWLVQESDIIGKAIITLYSVDMTSTRFLKLRQNRFFTLIR